MSFESGTIVTLPVWPTVCATVLMQVKEASRAKAVKILVYLTRLIIVALATVLDL
jgi:hypothetical protein